MNISIEVPDGILCNDNVKECKFLINGLRMSNQRETVDTKCKLFNCNLGYKQKEIYKCPMCIKKETVNTFTPPPGVK